MADNDKYITREEYEKLQKRMADNEKFGKDLKDKFSGTINSTTEMTNAFTLNVSELFGQLNSTMSKFADAINPLDSKVFQDMDQYATKIQSTFGLSKSRIDEFKKTIADAGPELAKLGISEEQMAQNLADVMSGLGTAASVSEEALVEMSAAAQLTDVPIKTLAESFRNVGVSIYDVGDAMKEVTNYARSTGVSVKAVSDGVVSNLGKMNLYNFDNGVMGLAKMAATSERLGISMDKTFQLAENLMSPEKAIDMSAALQRLGVTTGALLDPLRAMDLAQNDPAQLQKEIVNLSKEFTTFNEKTGKMEILPGAKRRLREVADAMGMTAEELAGMSIKAADFDMKLKQIKMPALAEGDEETKELIASMAQMKGGVATVQVRNVETGVTTEKRVEELTPEDIKELQKANEESSKSIEEISMNQLDQLTQIKNYLTSGEVSTKFAKATSPTLSRFYGTVASSYKEMAKGTSELIGSTEEMRKAQEGVYKPMEDIIKGRITGDKQLSSQGQTALGENVIKYFGEFEERFVSTFDATQSRIIDNIKETYSKPIKVEAKADSNLNLNLNLKSDVPGLTFTPAEVEKIKIAMLNDPDFAKKLLNNAGNNLVSASTGGKNQ